MDDVISFVKDAFPNLNFVKEKLKIKSNDSLKFGIGFIHRDKIMDSSAWLINVIVKLFSGDLYLPWEAVNLTSTLPVYSFT